ncbi:hypothetical protein EJ02DRAFT_227395 [Clathrospora elynae]|uniref:Uncharacterized protein n=1 Tax=Clathrospora elynae TaxID=706981 RepID=A0A6A5SLH1_9PLEO|nr:hypothetical protein EJ02DRAFT_227395 [Clathrospora elynae]
MSISFGFPDRGFNRHKSYDDSYSNGNESYGRNPRRMRENCPQRQAYARAFRGQQSSFGGMGGFSSPFMSREGPTPMMGGYPHSGFLSSFGMVMGHPGRSSFLGSSPMGYRQTSPFGLSSFPRSQSMFSSRHRQRGHSSWPRQRRSPFSSSMFDEDEDDESDYDTSSMYGSSMRRRGGLGHLGRPSPFGNRGRSSWMYGHNDGYDGYEDFDDEDDESDFEDYYPAQRRQRFNAY